MTEWRNGYVRKYMNGAVSYTIKPFIEIPITEHTPKQMEMRRLNALVRERFYARTRERVNRCSQ
jgi:hypothetical protein